MEPDWQTALQNAQPAEQPRTLGSRIGIGIGGSLLAWFVIDELLSFVGPWVVAGLVIAGLIFMFRGGAKKQTQQLQIFLILGAGVAGWMLLIFISSFLKFWIFILLTAVLAVVVLWKEHINRQRQGWLDQGCCANCGYDLRGTPDRCPECGRDTALDEPTWKKLRREWGHIKPADEVEGSLIENPAGESLPIKVEAPHAPMPVVSVPTVLKTPDFHEGPIPLEGDEDEPGA